MRLSLSRSGHGLIYPAISFFHVAFHLGVRQELSESTKPALTNGRTTGANGVFRAQPVAVAQRVRLFTS